MENSLKKINFNQIEKDSFIIVGYYNWKADIKHSLAKVTRKDEKSYRIDEISKNDKEDVYENSVIYDFILHDTIIKKKLARGTKENTIELLKGRKCEIREIYVVDINTVRAIAEEKINITNKKIKGKEEEIAKLQKENEKITNIMKKIGLLKVSKKKQEKPYILSPIILGIFFISNVNPYM